MGGGEGGQEGGGMRRGRQGGGIWKGATGRGAIGTGRLWQWGVRQHEKEMGKGGG